MVQRTNPRQKIQLSINTVCNENYALLTSLSLILISANDALAQESTLQHSNFLGIDNIFLVVAFSIPGLIILFVRSKFLTGKISSENPLIYYFAVSSIYYILAWLTVNSPFVQQLDYQNPWHMLFLLLLGPIVFGFLAGYSSRKGYIRGLVRRAGLGTLTHPIPAAWDWKFTDMKEEWVLVTLKDGTRFAGFFGEKSFASSDPQKRDMYIQWVYDLDKDDNWVYPKSEKGLLISAGEIRTIEFFPYPNEPNKEAANE